MKREGRASGLSRRRFLASSVGAGLGAGVAVALGDGLLAPAAADGLPAPRYLPFLGTHQTGIVMPPPQSGLMAAFDVTAAGRGELRDMLRELSDEARGLMTGRPFPKRDSAYPPLHAGTLGARPPAADLSVVVAVGASLFDERFGLGDRKPRELVKMPFFANDKLDPTRSHGDLLLGLSADTPDVNIFALRQLMRKTRGAMTLRWMLDGFNRRSAPQPGRAPARNLMGFRDGTANFDASDGSLMRRHVWVGADDDEPDWAVGGSYVAVRAIRMLVEFWDRTALAEQEAIIGRHKESGAPLDGKRETDLPRFDRDPEGTATPLDAHIRLANPRTPETDDNLILRRGFSFSRGFDGSGRLDQGLAFVSFQRSLERGFVTVQQRLDGEPLEEYIQPQGGGFYFALPGVRRDRGYLGEGLLA
ncbi:MAG: iron uptake transporter deferrochelatase/peroxidase subunit [Acidimicrobiia bacterium]